MPISRPRLTPSLLLAAAATGAALAAAAPAAVAAPDQTTTYDRTFVAIGAQQGLTLPAGVRRVDVVAIGGRGASQGPAAGQPARVASPLTATPGQLLWIVVGGNGSGAQGGFNGGATGLSAGLGAATGGGGGGASDVRTRQTFQPDSLDSRLLVAGGGGGSGANANGGGTAGGTGGGAGANGSGGTAGGNATGGGSGKAATTSAGGVAGGGGSGSANEGGTSGGTGQLGQGGAGGTGPNNAPPGGGGGGGGGLYGGGGGGGGAINFSAGSPIGTGGGGGGGGSSLVPAGGTLTAVTQNTAPSVRVQYTIPGTDITSAPAQLSNVTDPTLTFAATESGATFACRVDPVDEVAPFVACASPLLLDALADGAHRVEVRAVNAAGNYDATPAVVEFTVDTVAPVTTIDSGPSGETEDKQPRFSFSADTAGATFECRFDAAEFAPCADAGGDRPAAPLADGAHAFSVRATDAAGNVGAPVAREFSVTTPVVRPPVDQPRPPVEQPRPPVEQPRPPVDQPRPPVDQPRPPTARATLTLGKVTLDRRGGTAHVTVKVNGAGRVAIDASTRVRGADRTLRAAGTTRLTVKARGAALTALKRAGRVTVKVKVTFRRDGGGTITRTVTVRLRRG